MPDDVRKIIENASEFTPPHGDDNDDLPQRDKLILCATRSGELWHDADHGAYATVEIDGHLESYPVRSAPTNGI
ncbi:hypothetical protein VY88_33250 [Azospirillum thiophilum]|uniref:hypothetical protein n=1 Tax=Azospirillum thiophilum TaxID=528244 RepID=UPI0005F03278|nr:hypothetical protein [Azospirillum thiophilum]KJR61182.1 hypothetical protein VY88_33250 [Azospirillum thiophilum]